jgi:hypothetical protein
VTGRGKNVRGGNPITRYKMGSRDPECVAAYRAYMRKYMKEIARPKRRARKQEGNNDRSTTDDADADR